ncbi:MAG: hypothetical protein MRY83_09565 [Flavobacteriales bacterium]|nr:hypothetical protein [Flavobacteriales bacterium]
MYLLSTNGLVFSAHYCAGDLSKVSIVEKDLSCCCGDKDMSDCCENDTKFLEQSAPGVDLKSELKFICLSERLYSTDYCLQKIDEQANTQANPSNGPPGVRKISFFRLFSCPLHYA